MVPSHAIALHPYLTGHPFRARWLDWTHDYISGHLHFWHATGSEIADWYYAHYYEGAPE
jgi:allantoinase